MKKNYEMDMCNGRILGKMLRFAVPLMLSSMLQLLFNAADLVVIGKYGKELLQYILADEGYDGINNLQDCGAIYFTEDQKTEQGGSGAGCANTLFNGYFLKKMLQGKYSKILLVPTGALLSRDTPLQKETIPSIAHAIAFEKK